MTWSYIKYGDPTNLYYPLLTEADSVQPPAPPSNPRHLPPSTDHVNPNPCPNPSTPPRDSTLPRLPPLSSNVTLRRRRRLHISHTHFTPYIHPPLAPSENRPGPPQPILSLRNPLPPCQGICALNDHMRPYRGPVFLASQTLNPLQQCAGMVCMSAGADPYGGEPAEARCALVMCSYCVRFLTEWHKGRLGRMVGWWGRWLRRREERAWEEGKEEAWRWNMTWRSLGGAREELRAERVREEEEERRKREREGRGWGDLNDASRMWL